MNTAAASAAAASGGAPGNAAGGKGANVNSPRLPGTDVGHRVWRDSGTELRWGAAVQGSLLWDLDDQDAWFVEFWGRYDYVSPFTISNGVTSSRIDASSWSMGAGLGYRF